MINKKIFTITGNKTEMITLSSLIRVADLNFNHVFIHTGKSWDYDPKKYFLADLNLRFPDLFLECEQENSFVKIISELYTLMKKDAPDMLILTGNSNSQYAAIAAKELQIPIFYIPSGLLDSASSYGKEYAQIVWSDYSESLPTLQVLSEKFDKIMESYILTDLKLENGKYYMFSLKETDELSKKFDDAMNALNLVAQNSRLPVICAITTQQKSYIEKSNKKFHPQVKFITGLLFTDYIKLQLESVAAVTDSTTVIEEAEILSKPLIYTGNYKKEFIKYARKTHALCASYESIYNSINEATAGSPVNSRNTGYSDINSQIIKTMKAFIDSCNNGVKI